MRPRSWLLKQILGNLRTSPSRRRRARTFRLWESQKHRHALLLDALEPRCLLSGVYTVTNAGDSASPGSGTLRAAILASNADPGSVIQFNIPSAGQQVISLQSPLPTITQTVRIDGYTQGDSHPNTLSVGDNAVIRIELEGVDIPIGVAPFDALTIAASNCVVQGLDLYGFRTAISISAGNSNTVQGDFIGTDSTGNAPVLPNQTGVHIYGGSQNNTVGGTTYAARNLISDNTSDGVAITDYGTAGNVVEGSYIGTNASGGAPLGNRYGVDIVTASHNFVGGPVDTAVNIISGNTIGVLISAATQNVVLNNGIGTGATGTSAVPNIWGVELRNSSKNNQIGVYIAAHPSIGRNVISGNVHEGVLISDPYTNANVLKGNLIGLDVTGRSPLPNGNGISVEGGATSNTIGGVVGVNGSYAYFGNYISGNSQNGVVFDGTNTTGNVLQSNWIGPDIANSSGSPNLLSGVLIDNGASHNQIGGPITFGSSTLPGGNLISNNIQSGVRITDSGTSSNVVSQNTIGASAAGTAPQPNGIGVEVLNHARNNTIGGITVSGNLYSYVGNYISGNTGPGVKIDNAYYNQIQDNWIGLAVDASNLGNGGDGVLVNVSDWDTIGGSTTVGSAQISLGNVISANGGNGVALTGSEYVSILGNLIGTSPAGTGPGWSAVGSQGNAGAGISVSALAGANSIGGTGSLDGNVIGGNTNGIELGDTSYQNFVQGNKIGTDSTGTSAVANVHGILVEGGYNNIGGLSSGAGNLISGNSTGVEFSGPDAIGNSVQGNRIGTDITGTTAIHLSPNHDYPQYEGVVFAHGASQNTIGGTVSGSGNIIGFNSQHGIVVYVSDPFSMGNSFLENSIYANGPLGVIPGGESAGIELQYWPGYFSAIPVANGPNNYQNAPILTSAIGRSDGTVLITGAIASTPNTIYRIELFASPTLDPTLRGQGKTFLDAVNVITDSSGNGSFSDAVSFQPDAAIISSTATDLTHFVGSTSEFSHDVSVINKFPVLTSVSPSSATEGPLTLTLNGSDFLADSVVLFNGTPVPTSLVSPTQLSASVPASLVEGGTASVAVSNQGPLGGTSSALSLTIADAPLTIAQNDHVSGAWAGATFTAPVAFFSDGGGLEPLDHYRASIQWGDGSESNGSVKFIDGTLANVFGTHAYASEGTYQVVVFVRDDGGSQAQISETVTISDAPLINSVSKSIPFTASVSSSHVLASFQDGDPRGAAGDFAANIDWGDGSTSTGTVVPDGTIFDVTGDHIYDHTGSYSVTVTIKDAAGGATLMIPSTALVTAPPLVAQATPLTVTGNKKFSGTIAMFSDPDPSINPNAFTATVTWDDGTTSSTAAGTLKISGTNPYTVSVPKASPHTFAAFGGTHTISITIGDAPGGQNRSVTVVDRVVDPPALDANGRFVTGIYQSLLGHATDDIALNYWTSQLHKGVSRPQLVGNILASPAFVGPDVQRRAFIHYIHRAPNDADLQLFTKLVTQGQTLSQVQSALRHRVRTAAKPKR